MSKYVQLLDSITDEVKDGLIQTGMLNVTALFDYQVYKHYVTNGYDKGLTQKKFKISNRKFYRSLERFK